MTANEILIADAIKITHDPALTQAAAQIHTTAWWLAEGVAIVDQERYAEAKEAIYE